MLLWFFPIQNNVVYAIPNVSSIVDILILLINFNLSFPNGWSDIFRHGDFNSISVVESTQVYQEAMNKYLYLPTFSSHDHSCMVGVIKHALIRDRILCSSGAAFFKTAAARMQRLRNSGYRPYLDCHFIFYAILGFPIFSKFFLYLQKPFTFPSRWFASTLADAVDL